MAILLAARGLSVIMVPGCRGKPAMNKHRMNKKLSSFASRLRELITNRQPAIISRQFSELALEIFALQFKYNSAYRKMCEARRLTPQVVEHWTQIPAAPTAVFKELELTSLAPGERTTVFHSSGTTEQKPSRHFHNAESLAIYEASLWNWFQLNFGDERELVFLTPNPIAAPFSSLVHMFETVSQKAGGASVPASRAKFFGDVAADGAWVIHFDSVVKKLKSAGEFEQPLALLGTAFSFVHLLDYLVESNLSFQLPKSSRVMETGGYKNRSRLMPKTELHALITKQLGITPDNIICEYGMSELSSQAYAVTGDKWQLTRDHDAPGSLSLVTSHFHFPPWARVQIISPETGHEVADGETGLIRVFDLANVFSVAAIQTEDLGIRRGDGFELIGRTQLTEPRGCSLMTV
jgi:hypothetical protein